MTDTYTKIVLTIIALALVAIVATQVAPKATRRSVSGSSLIFASLTIHQLLLLADAPQMLPRANEDVAIGNGEPPRLDSGSTWMRSPTHSRRSAVEPYVNRFALRSMKHVLRKWFWKIMPLRM